MLNDKDFDRLLAYLNEGAIFIDQLAIRLEPHSDDATVAHDINALTEVHGMLHDARRELERCRREIKALRATAGTKMPQIVPQGLSDIAPPGPMVGSIRHDPATGKMEVWTGFQWTDTANRYGTPGAPLGLLQQGKSLTATEQGLMGTPKDASNSFRDKMFQYIKDIKSVDVRSPLPSGKSSREAAMAALLADKQKQMSDAMQAGFDQALYGDLNQATLPAWRNGVIGDEGKPAAPPAPKAVRYERDMSKWAVEDEGSDTIEIVPEPEPIPSVSDPYSANRKIDVGAPSGFASWVRGGQ